MADTTPETDINVGPVRFSYMHVFEPKRENGKYQVSLIIPKSDTKTALLIKNALKAALAAKHPGLDWSEVPADKRGLRDGDVERKGDEAYADCFFINVSSSRPPGILERVNGALREIVDPSRWTSGDYGYANINCYGYGGTKGADGNYIPKGVTAGLNNILFTEKGEPLVSGKSASEAFADLDLGTEETPVDADDLLS